ncbi:MAG: hypothetical protein IIC94_05010, partial [Chloroflexi bacterium]|nr:hypothetical protein [Chloroflexota bacterium]
MNRNIRIAIIGVLILSIVGALPLFASQTAGTAKTLELETNGDVDNFVSNDAAADDDVLVTVHDLDAGTSGGSGSDTAIDVIFVSIEGNDGEIAIVLTETGDATGQFEGNFTVVDIQGEVEAPRLSGSEILADPADAGATALDVDDTTDFEVNQVILVLTEEMIITAIVDTDTLTVIRGANETTALVNFATSDVVKILDVVVYSGSVLTSGVDDAVTTIPVTSGLDFIEGMVLIFANSSTGIGTAAALASEQMTVTDIISNDLTVVRGANGTTKDDHATGEEVNFLLAVFEEDNGDDLTVKYDVGGGISVSKVTKVDSAGPIISDIFPDDAAFLKASTIVFSAEITDAGVSMGDDGDVTANTAFTIGTTVLNPASVTEQATDDVWDVNVSLSLVPAGYKWSLTAKDLVGNLTIAGADTGATLQGDVDSTATILLVDDGSDGVGTITNPGRIFIGSEEMAVTNIDLTEDPNQVTVDRGQGTTTAAAHKLGAVINTTFALTVDRAAPEIIKAFTGFAWDSDKKEVDINERDSIVVLFRETGTANEPDFLAAGTLTASDFVVEGNTITGLVFPNLDAVDGGANLSNMSDEIDVMDNSVTATGPNDETRYMVFITLEDDLASDAEPNVQI